jgi:uncharacterized membrane protein YeaQ/YmgE (transglycosylase-associated protein family)
MASLQEYVTRQFPQHDIDVLEPRTGTDLELTDNTVVSFVVGSRAGLDLLSTFRRSAPNAKVAAVEVRPSDRSVVPSEDEDPDGVVDVPAKRVAAYVLIGLVIFGVIATVVAWMITDSGMTASISGCFAALIGAIVGAIVGGSRFAGERATSQPRASGRRITVVAAFLDDDAAATSLAQSVGPAADYEVRIVDHSGGWRSPATGTSEP